MRLRIVNFKKYNPRKESMRPSWFRLNQDFFENPKHFGLANTTKFLMIYLMCQASKVNGDHFELHIDHARHVLGFTEDVILKDIEKLYEFAFLESTRTSSHELAQCRALQDRTEQNRTEQKKYILSGKPDVVNNLITLKTEEQSDQVEQAPKVDTNSALATKILKSFNNVSRRDFKATSKKNIQPIVARLKEGFTEEDFQVVTDFKVREWKDDPVMHKFLRPETVFGNKFEGYLQAAKNEVSAEGWSKEAIDFIFSGPREPISDA